MQIIHLTYKGIDKEDDAVQYDPTYGHSAIKNQDLVIEHDGVTIHLKGPEEIDEFRRQVRGFLRLEVF